MFHSADKWFGLFGVSLYINLYFAITAAQTLQ